MLSKVATRAGSGGLAASGWGSGGEVAVILVQSRRRGCHLQAQEAASS
jgi:hypothetical protein